MPKRILFKVKTSVFRDVAGRDNFLKEALQLLRVPSDMASMVKFKPLFTDRRLTEERLKELEQEAVDRAKRQGKRYDPPNFLTYLVMEIPDGVHPDKFLQILRADKNLVEYAYEQPEGREPVDPTNNADFPQQGYLQAGGINIVPVWPTPAGLGKSGLDGKGIKFADVERSWRLDHPDLMNGAVSRVEVRYGAPHNNRVIRNHGTAVLGIVAAVDNTTDIVGIAPNVDRVMVYSWSSGGEETPHEAIEIAALELTEGDVLLIERCSVGELNGFDQVLPQETDLIAYEIIREATIRGVIVVEPAGNDGENIDEFVFIDGTTFADRDSGALIVGSSMRDLSRNPNSNFGNRVDCFAWGDGVFTLDTANFNGTSAASAIIAGAVVALQGYSKIVSGSALSPDDLRQLFRNRELGIQSTKGSDDQIGCMPDIEAIVGHLEGS